MADVMLDGAVERYLVRGVNLNNHLVENRIVKAFNRLYRDRFSSASLLRARRHASVDVSLLADQVV